MPQSFSQLYVHLVFSTLDRSPWLTTEHRDGLFAYLSGISRELNAPTIRVGGVADHVHFLAFLPRTISIAKWVEVLKSNSCRWFKEQSPTRDRGGFAWQKGYGCFSVSPGHVDALKTYIENQEAHHRSETFQEEYRHLLRKYHAEFDERYVWG